MRKYLSPLILGGGGLAVLIGLCAWQLSRLEWKEDILARVEARMAEAPAVIPAAPTEADHEYLPVVFAGQPTGEEAHVLVSGTSAGQGYRVLSAFETDSGRRILLDQGLLPYELKDEAPRTARMEVLGNLLWPDENAEDANAPDLAGNIWYARDVPAIAAHLGTESVLVVLSATSEYDPRLTPLPVSTSGIKNDHLEYAITWALLALVWFSMTIYWIVRVMRKEEGR